MTTYKRFEDLPATARDYIERIESLIGVPVSVVGVGPDRSQTLVRGKLRDLIDLAETPAVR